MNEIASKFLLAGERFMSEIHLRQPAYSACGPFTKKKNNNNNKEYKNLKKQENHDIFIKTS